MVGIIKVAEPSFLEIAGKDQKKVFEIDKDGKVLWLKNGKLAQAKIDKDLALAFIVALCEGLGMSYERVIEKIKEVK